MELIATTTIICVTVLALLVLTIKCIMQVVDKYVATLQPPQVEIDQAVQAQLDELSTKVSGIHMAQGFRKR